MESSENRIDTQARPEDSEPENKSNLVRPETKNQGHNVKKQALGPNVQR